jgi:hypothetical protein
MSSRLDAAVGLTRSGALLDEFRFAHASHSHVQFLRARAGR